MVFSSPLFLFGFLPVFLLLYRLSPRSCRNIAALLLSIVFYAWGEPVFAFIAIGSALVDLVVVRALAATQEPRLRKLLLAVGVVANVGLLVHFKYTNFVWANAQVISRNLLHADLPAIAAVALPIGVSFIVFEKITYVVDVYRGIGRPAKKVGDYLLYVLLFPKLLAGPIIKYHDIERQLTDRPTSVGDLADGLQRFAIGLAKKVIIADAMGELADEVFAQGGGIGFRLAWLGALAFSLQIFFDFSGYSDMAIGLARTMGFRLMENFNRPYLAIGFGDFWRRWHISLSTWIRNYLYVPLGGDRVSTARTYVNLWICFLASGLWHGAAWTFVIWGAYHGFFLTLDRMFLKRLLLRLPRVIGIGFTFLAVTVGWVIFRAPNIAFVGPFLAAMVEPGQGSTRLVMVTPDIQFTMVVGLVLCFAPALTVIANLEQRVGSSPLWKGLSMSGAALLFIISLAKATTVAFHPFLYFRF